MLREKFEQFANMSLYQWFSVICVAVCATMVRLLVERSGFTLREFIIGSILSAFLAYLVALYCLDSGISAKMTGVIVGCTTYQANNLLVGLGKIGASFAKDPLAFFIKIKDTLKK